MNSSKMMTAAVLAATLPIAAQAASLAPGTYDAVNYNVGEGPKPPERTIWTKGNFDDGYSSWLVTSSLWENATKTANKGAPFYKFNGYRFWSMSDGKFTLDASGDALMTGTLTNVGDSNLAFNLSFQMTADGDGGDGYCGGFGNADCDALGDVDDSMWSFFETGVVTLTGLIGTATEGVEYTIQQIAMSDHGPQAGVGANDKDKGDLGFSSWFQWTRTDGGPATIGDYTFRSGGAHGDFNMDLIPPSAVPLPTPALMLLTALGAGAVAARRRKS